MLREPQHERKIVNDIKTPPFVLSPSKDSERVFQQPVKMRPYGPDPNTCRDEETAKGKRRRSTAASTVTPPLPAPTHPRAVSAVCNSRTACRSSYLRRLTPLRRSCGYWDLRPRKIWRGRHPAYRWRRRPSHLRPPRRRVEIQGHRGRRTYTA